MAQQYDNNNSGVLFTNADKKDDKHPDRKGSAEVDGVQYWVSGWINEVKNGDRAGQKFLKLKFERKDKEQNSSSNSRQTGRSNSGDAF